MKNIAEVLNGAKTVGIAGHIRPDGDCVGSCMALYLYLKDNYPEIEADVYMERPRSVFSYIDRIEEVKTVPDEEKEYDLFITCDVSTKDRIAVAERCFDMAGRTVCIDHHVSNTGFAQINHIRGEISSASEVLYSLMDPGKISQAAAAALYTGIIHDTGVFQYSSTKPETLRIAANLMEKGFDFSKIIESSFYEKNYVQNQVMGRVLTESIMLLDGKCIVGYLKRKDMDFYGVDSSDLEGIVNQLRLTAGVEVALFLYELSPQHFKVSLRSRGNVDVNKVAVYLGGGGHVAAAGADLNGSMYDVINNITEQIEYQLKEIGEA